MSDVTVKQFAEIVGIPADKLLSQLKEAGISAESEDSTITDDEKTALLAFLRASHGKSEDESASAPKKITLKRKTHSEIKLSSSSGQRGARTVNVEVRKKRTYVKRSSIIDEERKKLEEEAQKIKEAEERQAAEEQAKREHEEKLKAEQEAAEKARLEAEKLAQEQAEKETVEQAEQVEPEAVAEEPAQEVKGQEEPAEEQAEVVIEPAKDQKREKPKKKAPKAGTGEELDEKQKIAALEAEMSASEGKEAVRKDDKKPKKGAKKHRVHEDDDYYEEEMPSSRKKGKKKGAADESARGAKGKGKGKQGPITSTLTQEFAKPTAPVIKSVEIPETITVAELAKKLSIKASEVIKELMNMGTMATINQVLDQETAGLVVEEMGHNYSFQSANAVEEDIMRDAHLGGEDVPRPPVVTVMGHVDHGKTSLLDYIRSSRVTSGEAGGITQHIGAYHVESDKGVISFIDTPGHAAFTAMRSRGASVTDIVILVVAADDGVMPQTVEAIQHAKAAEVPIIVAVNKIDKPEAQPDKVKQELSGYEIIPEDWGGENMFVNVSAKTGDGIPELLDAILLQSEIMELTAKKNIPATGVVLEASLDKGRGPVATILVQHGDLAKGDIILSGKEFGRVRSLLDEDGKPTDHVGASMPAVVLGLSGVPNAGDDVMVLKDEKKAREIALFRQGKFRDTKLAQQKAAKLDQFFSQMGEGEKATLNVFIKSDVQGSAEALQESLTKLSNEEITVNVVAANVGGINESDVHLAIASQAILIGFNVRADATGRRLIESEDVDVRYYSVIYDVIDDVRKALSGMLSPEMKEQIIGLAEVRDVFRSSAIGAIAGCLVIEGTVKRSNPIRVLRDNVVIYEGELESLRRFKDDVNEVKAGTECGIGVYNYNDVKVGDQIECFESYEVAREI
ncbi:MAG: translation initiation factor IF-2 [Gammaproteobacteria bacterium]|nr:MAG: translation initiation factor IF-2 [Gammaproteobacteria bacterium]